MSGESGVAVRPVDPVADADAWGRMRLALWPGEAGVDSPEELRAALRPAADTCVLLAVATDGEAVGFAEARRRVDHVNGTDASPVGFLEGWYVAPAWRGRGVGRALVSGVEAWTRAIGCGELGSDALLGNVASHAAHVACGFEETERVVYFRKRL